MKKEVEQNIKESLVQALKSHKKNDFKVAENLYKKHLKSFPNDVVAYNNLGILFFQFKENQKAISSYEKAIKINPNYAEAYNNLGVVFKLLGDYESAVSSYEKAIKINPNYAEAYNNLGSVYKELKEYYKAKDFYENAIKFKPNYLEGHNNLGVVFKLLGDYKSAVSSYEKAIKINPNYTVSLNNLGSVFYELGEYNKSKSCYKKSIKANPNNPDAYWNEQAFAANIDEALALLKKLFIIDNKNIKAKIMLSVLQTYKGNPHRTEDLLPLQLSNHPFVRSAKWIFSLPKLPKIFFNRLDFFDAIIALSDNSRPFYEFGVWNGVSFKHLIKTFKKGFGFDTFSGLPEAWHKMPKGSYSSFGEIPKIEGGEFVAGKFEDTLPDFFSKERSLASLINFDADLYSSTLCALNYSNKVIDEKTILIFDELIMNENWEQDEFKALNEFCDNSGMTYEVIAFSFFTGQVALRTIKKLKVNNST